MNNKCIAACISTLGWCGYVPAPGTFASFLCMVVYGFLCTYGLNITALRMGTIALVVIGFYVVSVCLPLFNHKDPSCIVIDEVAGMASALVCVPFSWPSYIGVFVLFRLFDISKWGYIHRVEQFSGAYGVMLDDMCAALYAIVFFWAVYALCF